MRYVPPEGTTGPDTDNLILPETVIVRLKGGREFSHSVKTPKGRAANRLTELEIQGKYCDCAKRVLSDNKIERSLEILKNLEREPSLSGLMEILI